jgi:hypothetical protein
MQDAGWTLRRTDHDMWFARLTKGRMSVSIIGHPTSFPGQIDRTVSIILAGSQFGKMVSRASDPEALPMYINRADKILVGADVLEDNFEGSWRPGHARPMYVSPMLHTCVFFDNTVEILGADADGDEAVSIRYIDGDMSSEIVAAGDRVGWPRR